MTEICPHNVCTACYACLNACRKKAISFFPDEMGNLYPSINQDSCIDCGACVKACPNNSPVDSHYPLSAYVGCANDLQEQLSSTSGGVASAICRQFVKSGGVVYGCSGANPLAVHHIRIEKECDIDLLKGSKYVHSVIGRCYSLVKEDLQAGRKVLFIGTPCQVAGLYSFLHGASKNLYTIDFVCHGVPSQQVFNDSLRLLLKQEDLSKVKINYRFRDERGRSRYGLRIRDEYGKTILQEVFPHNDYMVGFLKALFYRENCYHCKYARPERVSDITLGDYADEERLYQQIPHAANGLSKILVSTNKGEELLKDCSSLICCETIPVDYLIKAGGQLVKPMVRHKSYDAFHRIYVDEGLEVAYSKILPSLRREIKRNQALNFFKKFIYQIPYAESLYRLIVKRKHVN